MRRRRRARFPARWPSPPTCCVPTAASARSSPRWPRFHTKYDSIQTSFNRRFRNGWQAGVNWTLGLRFEGNTLSPQHLVHNADGTIGLASYQEANDELLSNVGLRRHLIKGNFVWDLPNVESSTGAMKVISALANDWQLSGIFTARLGRAVRRDVYLPDGRREREPDRIAELHGAYPGDGRYRLGLLEQSVRAVQRGRVRRPDLQQHGRRVGRQPAERLLGPHDRSVGHAQHQGRRHGSCSSASTRSTCSTAS